MIVLPICLRICVLQMAALERQIAMQLHGRSLSTAKKNQGEKEKRHAHHSKSFLVQVQHIEHPQPMACRRTGASLFPSDAGRLVHLVRPKAAAAIAKDAEPAGHKGEFQNAQLFSKCHFCKGVWPPVFFLGVQQRDSCGRQRQSHDEAIWQ